MFEFGLSHGGGITLPICAGPAAAVLVSQTVKLANWA